MSATIDQRIVEMQFDNQRFEKNVSTSISTLDKLKNALKLDSASKGLGSIEKGFANLNLSGVEDAVNRIANRFSTLGIIGTAVLQNIGYRAFEAGRSILNMIKSMTISQIGVGWDKYAEKTTAVQTIMAATEKTWKKDAQTLMQLNALTEEGFDPAKASAYLQTWKNVDSGIITAYQAARNLGITVKEFQEITNNFGALKGLSFAGSQMDYVNSQMEKLNWFTDETSYNFTDMVGNIGKFTSNNIPLSQAVTSMQGIATWAAKSGQNATTASRVMYNLAQSIGAGSVKLMDWRSVETANMATAEFKEEALKAAAANGRLRTSVDKTGKTIYKTSSGLTVSVESFAESLASGWFDKNTLLSTLDKYGAFTNKLYEFSEASDLTATEILQLIDAQTDGEISQAKYQQIADDTGMTVEEVKSKLAELGSETYEFGRKAFAAAQEAKTFQEAIDATKEAAATKWSRIFENLFGDYEEAKELWTGLSEFLYDVFVTPLEKIEDLTAALGDLHFIQNLAKGFSYIFTFFKGDGIDTFGVFDSIAKGFRGIFPHSENLARSISTIIMRFRRWGNSIQLTRKQSIALQSAARGLARVFKLGVLDSIINLWNATEPLRTSLSTLATALVNFFIKIGRAGNGMKVTALSGEILKDICERLSKVINKVSESLDKLSIDSIRDKFSKFANVIEVVKQSLINIWNATEPLRTSISNLFGALGGLLEKVLEVFGEFEPAALEGEGLKTVCENLALKIDAITEAINNISVDDIRNFFSNLSNTISKVNTALSGFVELVSGLSFGDIFSGIVSGIEEAFKRVKEFITTKAPTLFKTLAIVGGGAFLAYKAYIVYWLLTPLKNLSELIGNIADMPWYASVKQISGAIKNIAIAVGILAVALLVLSYVDYERATEGLLLIAGIIAVLWYSLDVIKKTIDFRTITKFGILASSLIMVAAAFLLLSVAVAAFTAIAKWGGALEGLGIMLASLFVLVLAIDALEDVSPKVYIGVGAILALTIALFTLSIAVAAFMAIAKWGGAIEGLGVMVASLFVVAVAFEAFKEVSPKVYVGVGAILALSIALFALAIAVAAFTAIAKFGGAIEAFGIMLGALFIIAVAFEAFKDVSAKVYIGIGAVLALSVALIALSAAVASFALVGKMDKALEGLGIMIGSLAILVMALDALEDISPKVYIGVFALLALSAVLLVLSAAVGAFAKIATMDGAIGGMLMLTIALATLVVALMALAPIGPVALAAAAALLVISVACIALAAAVYIVSLALPLLGMGLQVLVEGISAGLIAFGDAVLSIGANLAALIYLLATNIAQAIQVLLTSIGEGIGEFISAIGTGIGEGLSGLSDGIVILGEGIAESILVIAESVSGALSELGTGVSSFGEGVGALIEEVLGAVALGVEEVVASVGKGIGDGISAIGSSITDVGTGIGDINIAIIGFGDALRSLDGISWLELAGGITAIGKSLNDLKVKKLNGTVTEATSGIVQACTEMSTAIQTALEDTYILIDSGGETIVENAENGINSKVASVRSAGISVGQAAVNGFRAGSILARSIGRLAAQGFIDGFLSKELEAYLAGRKIAGKSIEGARDRLREQSPSKEFFKIGDYAGQGFINGLLSTEDAVENAGISISKSAMSSVVDSLAYISEMMDQNVEFNPTIRPVLDSSIVESGLSRLSKIGTTSYMDAKLNASQDLSEIQNGNKLLASALANINSQQEYKELNQFTMKDAEAFISIGNRIIGYLQDGHDIFFDDGSFAGRINRRLGSI